MENAKSLTTKNGAQLYPVSSLHLSLSGRPIVRRNGVVKTRGGVNPKRDETRAFARDCTQPRGARARRTRRGTADVRDKRAARTRRRSCGDGRALREPLDRDGENKKKKIYIIGQSISEAWPTPNVRDEDGCRSAGRGAVGSARESRYDGACLKRAYVLIEKHSRIPRRRR